MPWYICSYCLVTFSVVVLEHNKLLSCPTLSIMLQDKVTAAIEGVTCDTNLFVVTFISLLCFLQMHVVVRKIEASKRQSDFLNTVYYTSSDFL